MSRFVRVLLGGMLLAVCLAPAVAKAQAPGPGAPMPLGIDFSKVPVGSWADYQITVGTFPPMKTRLALVGKAPAGATIEMGVEGGMMAMAGGKMVVATLIEPAHGKEQPAVKKLVMQLGANEPMDMPPEMAQRSQFKKPDPKTLVKEETVKVPAGSFKAKHYRDKTATGAMIDYWISDGALPLGLVKMQGESVPGSPGPMLLELTALGKDAKPTITKPAKPFDEAKFRQQVMSAGGHGGPPPGHGRPPPPVPPGPAPAPKK
jgi:hypothetical protein